MSTTTFTTFKVGNSVRANNAVDYSNPYRFFVVKRTKCFVTLEDVVTGKEHRAKIRTDERGEWALPFGSYSMAPVARA